MTTKMNLTLSHLFPILSAPSYSLSSRPFPYPFSQTDSSWLSIFSFLFLSFFIVFVFCFFTWKRWASNRVLLVVIPLLNPYTKGLVETSPLKNLVYLVC